MRAYLHRHTTISVFDSIDQGILKCINHSSRQLHEPDYKGIVPANYLRRMTKVIKMGVAAALNVAEKQTIKGIIVGSGSGCCYNSLLFIQEFHERAQSIISPNAFIQSTDNTIAGQIALILKNYSYNISYIQKGIAFENALIDALMLSSEIDESILVGGVDEWIPKFELTTETKSQQPEYWIGEGASFFIINQQATDSLAKINACAIVSANKTNVEEKLNSFLKENQLPIPDLILYGNSYSNQHPLGENIMAISTFNYSNLSGIYFTNSAFALQLGAEIISNPSLAKSHSLEAKNILIVNNFNDVDFGLTYLSAV